MDTAMLRERGRLRRWELALLVGVAAALLAGVWLDREQAALSDKVIRLHVIANSDTEADQALKLRMRDRILEEMCIRDSASTVGDGRPGAQPVIGVPSLLLAQPPGLGEGEVKAAVLIFHAFVHKNPLHPILMDLVYHHLLPNRCV